MKFALTILIFLASTSHSGASEFVDLLRGKLVKLDPASSGLVEYEISEGAPPEYFLIYFSAHWCAPCRKMTPALVGFYKEIRETHPEVELVFVSADRDEQAMVRYAGWAEMPWPILAWDQRQSINNIAELRPRAIPYMALFDRQGHLLGASDTGGFNVGIPRLLNGLQEKLGTELYDIQERHGKKSPLVPIFYALAAISALVVIIRRAARRDPNQ